MLRALNRIKFELFWHPYVVLPLLAGSIGYFLASALDKGMIKSAVALVLFPVGLFIPYLLTRIRKQNLFFGAICLFWVPIPIAISKFSPFRYLYAYEFVIFVMFILQVVQFLKSKSHGYAIASKPFPFLPFGLYILGAFMTYFVTQDIVLSHGNELAMIRLMCIFPVILFIVTVNIIRSVEDAQRAILVMLSSAMVLGIVFLVGRYLFSWVTLSEYGLGSGRLSMSLRVPFLGSLEMLQAGTACKFAYLAAYGFSFWIFHPSRLIRVFGGVVCMMAAIIIILTQGRVGAMTMIASMAFISAGGIFVAKKKGAFIRRILPKMAIVFSMLVFGLFYVAAHSSSISLMTRLTELLSSPTRAPNIANRIELWVEGFELYLNSPVFGSGMNIDIGGHGSQVHYFPLEILLIFGLLGFIGLVAILWSVMRVCYAGTFSENRNLVMLCIPCIWNLISFFLGQMPYWAPWTVATVWSPIAICYTAATLERRRFYSTHIRQQFPAGV